MSRWVFSIALAVLILAAALRFRGAQRWALNNDEIVQVQWSSRSFSDMMTEVRRDAVHPPLDYFIQFLVGRLGGPEWSRRIPNIVFGIATVGLVMILGRWWSSPAAGLIAGLLMALAPMHIRYSQEIRPYSSALFFILASLAVLEYYARTQRLRWFFAWAVLVFLAGATLYFAGMVVGVVSIFRIFAGRRNELRVAWRWLPSVIVAWTLLYSPWFLVIAQLVRNPSPQPADTLDWPWWSYRAQTMATGDYGDETVTLGSWAFWVAVLIGIGMSIRQREVRVAAVWLVIGGALQILVLQIHPHYSDPRYLISALPAAFILAGAGIAALARNAFTVPVAVTLIVLFAGFATPTLNAYYRGERPDWRAIAIYVHQRVKTGETIIATNHWVVRNFGFYCHQLPPLEGVTVEPFSTWHRDFIGPAWIVSGQCFPRQPLLDVGLMKRFPRSELAQVRRLREGERLPMGEEICPHH